MQSTGESDKFAAEPGKGRSVSDMMMQALADAMMSQMRGRVWNSSDGAHTPEATVSTVAPTMQTPNGTATPPATPTEASNVSLDGANNTNSSSPPSSGAGSPPSGAASG